MVTADILKIEKKHNSLTVNKEMIANDIISAYMVTGYQLVMCDL